MKAIVLTLLILFSACQSKQEIKAEDLTTDYIRFVDSIADTSVNHSVDQWVEIQKYYDQKIKLLNTEVDKIEDKTNYNDRINNASSKYEHYLKTRITK